MAINEILFMTKPKLVLLAVLLIAFIPKYYNSNCPAGSCPPEALATVCQCGFFAPNFFTIFILSYISACVIVEAYNLVIKGAGKKNN